jgi:signal transduction histidine kinase
MKTASDRRILLGGVGLALVVSAGLGWLVLYALSGARAAQVERHRAVVERLFDEFEGELSALVAREESRSFFEYRYFYVPPGQAYQAGLVQSDLSTPPKDKAIVGWFQVDPGGVVSTPALPRANELSLATNTGWEPNDEALALRDELAHILRDIPGWSEPSVPSLLTPRLQPASVPVPLSIPLARPTQLAGNTAQAPSPKGLLLQRGSAKRADRQTQVISTQSVNWESFNPSEQKLEELVQDNNQKPAPVQQQKLEVEVTPFSGLRRGDHLVLHRVVRVGPETHRQGLVLRLDALRDKLEQTVLEGSPLRPYLALGWNGSPVEERTYRYDHRFAEPFTSVAVTATLHRVPELVGNEARSIRLLAAVLLLAITVGGLGLYRAVQTQLEYARRRNDFVAAVSHELKTPLTTIRMYAEMLRDGMVPTPEKQRAYHHTITMESDRLGRLISNVLELARLERGGLQPTTLVGQLEPVVHDAVEVVRPHAQQSGFRLEVHAEPDLPPVQIDPDALTQIVVNLVDNAVKFSGSGERRIELHLRERQGRVQLSVRDHGPGVPQSQLRKVFEPFWRGERELTRRTRGTGIGLALVRGLAQRMGGQVWARNHPEGGFEITIGLLAQAR